VELEEHQPTIKYLNYPMRMVRLLLHYGVTPVMVLDGRAHLPAKQLEQEQRRNTRQHNREAAMKAKAEGNLAEYTSRCQKCVEVTHDMALQLAAQLHRINVEVVLSPFESDAQISWMVRTGNCHVAISEDSDLVVFGCPRVLYKMDRFGNGLEYSSANMQPFIAAAMPHVESALDALTYVSILSGCDYEDGIPGVAIKTAISIVKENPTPRTIFQHLQRKAKCSDSYADRFSRAYASFRYQLVLRKFSGVDTVGMLNGPLPGEYVQYVEEMRAALSVAKLHPPPLSIQLCPSVAADVPAEIDLHPPLPSSADPPLSLQDADRVFADGGGHKASGRSCECPKSPEIFQRVPQRSLCQMPAAR
jgi:5'-3' exonuclease